MTLHPAKLFLYALAFRFSSGHGRCFSPGFKAMAVWYASRVRWQVLDVSAAKWWRARLERD